MISFNTPPATLLEGSGAVDRFSSVGPADTTVDVACRYTGDQSCRAVWGSDDGVPFVYFHDSGSPDVFASDADAQALYQASMSALVTRQSLVNSDPRSPDHFSPERSLDAVADEINRAFGTTVEDIL